jgi:hypothetical protein
VAEPRETYWTLVEGYSQIVGRAGEALDVGVRDAQDSVIVGGARYPIDPWGRVTVIEPDMGNAIVTLVTMLGAEVIEMVEETGS